MSDKIRERIKDYMDEGVSKERASAMAFSDVTFDDFMKAVDSGIDFDEHAVRVAAVHTRLDMAMACYQIMMVNKNLEKLSGAIRWAMFCIMVASLVVVFGK